MKTNTSYLLISLILTLYSCGDGKTIGQSSGRVDRLSIEPFEVTIFNGDYSMAYSLLTILTNNELQIVFKGGLVGEKDSVLFSRSLRPSDTLQEISKIKLDSLKENYSNDCMSDGSQVSVTLKKNGKEKS